MTFDMIADNAIFAGMTFAPINLDSIDDSLMAPPCRGDKGKRRGIQEESIPFDKLTDEQIEKLLVEAEKLRLQRIKDEDAKSARSRNKLRGQAVDRSWKLANAARFTKQEIDSLVDAGITTATIMSTSKYLLGLARASGDIVKYFATVTPTVEG